MKYSSTVSPWAETMDLYHSVTHRIRDLSILKSFLLQGLWINVEEEKVRPISQFIMVTQHDTQQHTCILGGDTGNTHTRMPKRSPVKFVLCFSPILCCPSSWAARSSAQPLERA